MYVWKWLSILSLYSRYKLASHRFWKLASFPNEAAPDNIPLPQNEKDRTVQILNQIKQAKAHQMLDILSESEQIEFALLVLLKNKRKAQEVLKNKIPSGKDISLKRIESKYVGK